jgi:outer membrane protein OmpA-like peptidoglycan-associated protein
MSLSKSRKIANLGAMPVMALAMFSTVSLAQDVKVEGQIKGRSGSTIIMQTTAEPYVNVLLEDTTRVAQRRGVLRARRKNMSMVALIPGLQITVEGTYDANKMLVAKSITFSGDDLERAYSIQAGLSETEARSKQNAEEVAKHQAELEKQNAALAAQNAALQQQQAQLKGHQEQLKEHQEKIAANKALIAANTARFGQLDDYYIYDEVTVLFGNGQTKVDPKYNDQLKGLAQKAQTVEGYMIQVKGFASASGSAALNQKLSADRADKVTAILLQQARVPLPRMLAPAAMGESQAKKGATPADEANDRKVVVRVLQNKGIAGIQ